MISSQAPLDDLVGRLQSADRIAFDTEADSLHCYFEKVCLLQISAVGEDALVDPLASLQLQPLFDVLASKRLILHGADYDLRLLRRVGQFEPSDLFDTMIAARLCGEPAIGLAALVLKFFGVTLSKASQKANWAIRPLSDQMVDYAINDTRHLCALADQLEADLHRLGRWDWFTESRDRMVAATREVRLRDDASVWRISGSAALSARAQAVLRILWFWRDAEARAWDRPPFHVIGNEDMIKVATQITEGKPFSTPRMNGRRKKSFEIVVALAMQIPESEWPKPIKVRRKRPTKDHLDRFEELRKKRDAVAAELGLDPSIIAPRGALDAVAENPESPMLMNWQKALLA